MLDKQKSSFFLSARAGPGLVAHFGGSSCPQPSVQGFGKELTFFSGEKEIAK